jgi:hypothetical protein
MQPLTKMRLMSLSARMISARLNQSVQLQMFNLTKASITKVSKKLATLIRLLQLSLQKLTKLASALTEP